MPLNNCKNVKWNVKSELLPCRRFSEIIMSIDYEEDYFFYGMCGKTDMIVEITLKIRPWQ